MKKAAPAITKDVINLTVTNAAGTKTSAVSIANIVDDVPTFAAPTISVNTTVKNVAGTTSINFGADGFAKIEGTGTYGTFTMQKNGKWTYALNAQGLSARAKSPLTDNVTITATDSDGSVISQEIQVEIKSTAKSPVFGAITSAQVSETELQTSIVQGTGSINLANDIESLSVQQHGTTYNILQDNLLSETTLQTSYGTIEFTSFKSGKLSYTYTLNTAPKDNATYFSDTLTFVAKNAVGTTTEDVALAQIADGGASITTYDPLKIYSNEQSATFTFDVDFGVDGAAGNDAISVSAQYGTITQDTLSGTWVYTLNSQGKLARSANKISDTVSIVATDSDGTKTTKTLPVTIYAASSVLPEINGVPTQNALVLPMNTQDLTSLKNKTTKLNLSNLGIAYQTDSNVQVTISSNVTDTNASAMTFYLSKNSSAATFNADHTSVTLKGSQSVVNNVLKTLYFAPTEQCISFAQTVEDADKVGNIATVSFAVEAGAYAGQNSFDFVLDSYEHSTFSLSGKQKAYVNSVNDLTASDFKNSYYSNASVIDAEKSPKNSKDDLMCWAATDANMLEWTGWGRSQLKLNDNALDREDKYFAYYVSKTATPGGYYIEDGLNWFFDGTYFKVPNVWKPTNKQGNIIKTNPNNYVYYQYYANTSSSQLHLMQDLSHALQNGYGVGLSIHDESTSILSQLHHAITCWGFSYDTSKNVNSHDYYTGIYITDSDDSKSYINPTDDLKYCPIKWDAASQRYLIDIYPNFDNVYIRAVTALTRCNGTTQTFADYGNLVDSSGSQLRFTDNYTNNGVLSNLREIVTENDDVQIFGAGEQHNALTDSAALIDAEPLTADCDLHTLIDNYQLDKDVKPVITTHDHYRTLT